MKSKPTPEPTAESAAPDLNAKLQIQPGEKVPPGFEAFEGLSLQQIVSRLSPNVKNFAALAALMPDMGLHSGVPQWAKNAGIHFWRTTGIGFTPGIEPLPPSMLGKLAGLIEEKQTFADEQLTSAQLHSFMGNVGQFLKSDAANASPEVAKEFFQGRADTPSVLDKMRGLSQRAKVFLVIAVAWQGVETFASAGALHRWLLDEKIIAAGTDAAETRKICRLIGFNPKEKAGRPAKTK